MFKKLENPFYLDPRSMALFRIGLGLMIILDLALRAYDLEAFYADSGVTPRAALFDLGPYQYRFSLHFASGLWWVQAGLFALSASLALSLIAGFKTRWVTIASWIMLVSLQNRNPLVSYGGDSLLKFFTLWAIFLPLGARYSIDALRGPSDKGRISDHFVSLATFAFILQVTIHYSFAALSKSSDSWLWDGTATHYALQLDRLLTPFGVFFRDLMPAEGLRWMTYSVWFWEALGPLLLLLPIRNPLLRYVFYLGFTVMHLSFHLMMHINIFPLINCVVLVALLPGHFWERTALGRQFASWLEKLPTAIDQFATNIRQGINRPKIQFLFQRGIPGALILGTLSFIIMTNFKAIDLEDWGFEKSEEMGVPLKKFGSLFQINQKWHMFANPYTKDGWYVFDGELVDRSPVNLAEDFHNNTFGPKDHPPSIERPDHMADLYRSHRWRKYLKQLHSVKNTDQRAHFGNWVCINWNKGREPTQQLREVKATYMTERSTETPMPKPIKQNIIVEYKCDPSLYEKYAH